MQKSRKHVVATAIADLNSRGDDTAEDNIILTGAGASTRMYKYIDEGEQRRRRQMPACLPLPASHGALHRHLALVGVITTTAAAAHTALRLGGGGMEKSATIAIFARTHLEVAA